jgi:hypothetical protein
VHGTLLQPGLFFIVRNAIQQSPATSLPYNKFTSQGNTMAGDDAEKITLKSCHLEILSS